MTLDVQICAIQMYRQKRIVCKLMSYHVCVCINVLTKELVVKICSECSSNQDNWEHHVEVVFAWFLVW